MSAPSTNVKKQSKRHRPALWGMITAVLIASLLFLGYLANIMATGTQPGDETEKAAPSAATDG